MSQASIAIIKARYATRVAGSAPILFFAGEVLTAVVEVSLAAHPASAITFAVAITDAGVQSASIMAWIIRAEVLVAFVAVVVGPAGIAGAVVVTAHVAA